MRSWLIARDSLSRKQPGVDLMSWHFDESGGLKLISDRTDLPRNGLIFPTSTG